MVLALCAGVALSQAFRTVGAIMASPLQADFRLSAQALGIFSGAFHFAFGAMQLFMGIGIDLHGVRRTVLVAFPIAIAGALLSAVAPNYLVLVAGQALIGVGCAPAFLVCTVFIARHFPAARFATVSGMVLAVAAALAWLAIWYWVHEPAAAVPQVKESIPEAIRQFGALFAMPHTLGIVVLGAVTYAAFISLRGLWLGPLMMGRHGYSLVESGNVAVAVSVISLFGAPLFGRLDRDGAGRRRWIVICGLGYAGLFALIAVLHSAWLDIAGMVLIGVLSGFIVWQYADVRGAYPATLTGRAMAVFTMAMFLGVALMQWGTGVAASVASAHGGDPLTAVLATIAVLLVIGIAAFAWLPAPKAGEIRS